MEARDTRPIAASKALDVNAAAWNLLAERSRALVHHLSLLMGVLTQPTLANETASHALVAGQAETATTALIQALAAAPELAAHRRTIQRFEATLPAWQRCVDEASPLVRRYQTALLQHAAQTLTSCLHVESLATSESARIETARADALRALEARADAARDASHGR